MEHKKELECQLHAADHNKLNEITEGLLVSANHLAKVHYNLCGIQFTCYIFTYQCICLSDNEVEVNDLIELDLRHFIQWLYNPCGSKTECDATLLENIGIKRCTVDYIRDLEILILAM